MRHRVEPAIFRPLVSGEKVRDWGVTDTDAVFFPYGLDGLVSIDNLPEIYRVLWPCRTELGNRATFSKRTYFDEGRAWWEWHQIALECLLSPLTITWSEIATTNNFVLDRGGSVFSQTAPVMKLKADMSLSEHIQLLGALNSSVGCFWMKQCCFPKGGSGIGRGIQNEAWESRYAFNATAIANFPLPAHQPSQLPTVLVQTSATLQGQSPAAVLNDEFGMTNVEGAATSSFAIRHASLREALANARDQARPPACGGSSSPGRRSWIGRFTKPTDSSKPPMR